MSDTQSRLEKLARAIEKARTLQSRAEGHQEQLNAEKERILAEMKEAGVTPETLDAEIMAAELDLEQAVQEAEALIPWDLIGESPDGE